MEKAAKASNLLTLNEIRGATIPPRDPQTLDLCKICSKNPPLDNQTCVCCFPNPDLDQPCYNCDLCVATRLFLKSTDDQWQLWGYEAGGELWTCQRCKYITGCACMCPSIIRDVIHEQARKSHKFWLCDELGSSTTN